MLDESRIGHRLRKSAYHAQTRIAGGGRNQNVVALNTEFVRQTRVDTAHDRIKARVCAVNGDVMLDRRLHNTCLRRLSADLF